MTFSAYEEAAYALAWTMFLVCEPRSDPPTMMHLNENDLNAVPDMLARLGIMRAVHMAHEFAYDWNPQESLPIKRHPGEPDISDLGIGLDFCIAWYVGDYVHAPTSGRHACIEAAVKIGRGIMVDGEYLPEDDRGEEIASDYWSSRARAIERLGSVAALYPTENAK